MEVGVDAVVNVDRYFDETLPMLMIEGGCEFAKQVCRRNFCKADVVVDE